MKFQIYLSTLKLKNKMKKITLITILTFNLLMGFSQVINSYNYENVINTGSKTVYKDGVSKTYYIENGVSVTTSANLLKQYGKYFQIHIEIENLTGSDFLFNPSDLVALMTNYKTDKKTKVISVDNQTKGVFLSSEEYIKKVQRNQNFQSAMYGLGAYSNANSAGYSTSTTTTKVSGYSNTYGSVDNYYNNKYTGESVDVSASTYGAASGTSVTKSYNGQAAYQARKEADRETAKFDNELYQIRSELNQNYLKINTIEHRQRLKGSINLKFEDVDRIELLVPVNGKYYSFIYNNHQENTPQQQIVQNNSNFEISSNAEVVTLFNQAKSHFNNKRFQDQLSSLNDALKIEPKNSFLLSQRASLYAFQLNDKEKGLIDLDNAILVDTTNKFKFNNYLLKSSIEFVMRKYTEMNLDATEAINLQPEKIDGYFYRALAKSCLDDNYSAINDYEKVISISKKSFKQTDNLGTVYNNLGYCYLKVKDYEKSKPLLDKAVELQPNLNYVWGSLGEFYYNTGEYKKCIEAMTTAIDLVEKGNNNGGVSAEPSTPYYFRALAKIKKDKIKESCVDLSKAIELGNKEAQDVFNKFCK